MGHTVNSVAKRLLKLEKRVCELEDEVDEVQSNLVAKEEEGEEDRRWVAYVEPEEFEPLCEEGYVCETNNCNDETWRPAVGDHNVMNRPEHEGSMAHWRYVGDWPTADLPTDVSIPCYICSGCMQAVLDDWRNR